MASWLALISDGKIIEIKVLKSISIATQEKPKIRPLIHFCLPLNSSMKCCLCWKQTKNKIIELYDYGIFPVYFCEYLKQIPIGHNTLNTVGKSKIDDIFIRGTPSLIYISENKVVFNVAGRSEVLDMIDLYLKIE
mgnify:CR=1 FL=1